MTAYNKTYQTEFEKFKNIVEQKLDEYIEIKYPESIYKSMKYSLCAPGKRLRPVMLLETVRMLSGDTDAAIPTACAVEMLHTQSLIHDDLPCMDNDDFRRGLPSNHKAFGESTAVLAGDALLTYAPKLIIDKTPVSISADILNSVLYEFFTAAGTDGIISGQIVDLESEGKIITPDILNFIHEYKTAKMFVFPVKAGALLASADKHMIDELTEFAKLTGHAFQICDDILDEIADFNELGKTPGKDVASGKATYVSVFGMDKAKKDACDFCTRACAILKSNNIESVIFQGIISDIRERVD